MINTVKHLISNIFTHETETYHSNAKTVHRRENCNCGKTDSEHKKGYLPLMYCRSTLCLCWMWLAKDHSAQLAVHKGSTADAATGMFCSGAPSGTWDYETFEGMYFDRGQCPTKFHKAWSVPYSICPKAQNWGLTEASGGSGYSFQSRLM